MACTLNDKSDGDAPLFDESQQVEHEVEDSAGNMVAHDRLLQSINQLDSKTAARYCLICTIYYSTVLCTIAYLNLY